MDRPILVFKVGTSSIVDPATQRVKVSALARLAESAVRLIGSGFHVILVSSGAVGLGCSRLGLKEKPSTIAAKQAAAAVGQVRLMSLYDDVFSVLGQPCAQVLLTYETFGERTQYLNARNTMLELLKFGVVPVVNENDTVAVQELKVGDNDTLSALVAAMVGAQMLFLMTDVEALFDGNPRVFPDAVPIRLVSPRETHIFKRQMIQGLPRLSTTEDDRVEDARRVDNGVVVVGGSSAVVFGGSAVVEAAGVSTAAESLSLPASVDADCATTSVRISASTSIDTPAVALAPPHKRVTSPALVASNAGSAFGTGGMVTKLKAAQLASAAGVSVVITATDRIEALDEVLSKAGRAHVAQRHIDDTPGSVTIHLRLHPTIFHEMGMGTTFLPFPKPVTGRKRWILALIPSGQLVLDAGAASAIVDARKSLFPAGIIRVVGDFDTHDAVQLVDERGHEIARALVNYSAEVCRKVRGRRSKDIADVVGYLGAETVADRDNIVILKDEADKMP